VTDDDDVQPADDWLTLSEAASQLGVSIDAVRRRMRRGEFQRRQIRTRHGVTWQVRLSGNDPGATLANTVVPTVALEPTVEALLAYLRDRDQIRDAEVAQLREDLGRARADLVDHAMQLAEAREQMRALHAPAPQPDSAASAINDDERQELEVLCAEHTLRAQTWDQAQAHAQRSWWRRLLG
jgi:DNA-binding transcriptional MerR regulator